MHIFTQLTTWWKDLGIPAPSLNTNNLPGQKRLMTVKDLVPRRFCDLYCKVILKAARASNGCQVIVITDFTANKKLETRKGYLDNVLAPLPPNLMIVCTLWDNHADVEVEEGDYLLLKNCRAKTETGNQSI